MKSSSRKSIEMAPECFYGLLEKKTSRSEKPAKEHKKKIGPWRIFPLIGQAIYRGSGQISIIEIPRSKKKNFQEIVQAAS